MHRLQIIVSYRHKIELRYKTQRISWKVEWKSLVRRQLPQQSNINSTSFFACKLCNLVKCQRSCSVLSINNQLFLKRTYAIALFEVPNEYADGDDNRKRTKKISLPNFRTRYVIFNDNQLLSCSRSCKLAGLLMRIFIVFVLCNLWEGVKFKPLLSPLPARLHSPFGDRFSPHPAPPLTLSLKCRPRFPNWRI